MTMAKFWMATETTIMVMTMLSKPLQISTHLNAPASSLTSTNSPPESVPDSTSNRANSSEYSRNPKSKFSRIAIVSAVATIVHQQPNRVENLGNKTQIVVNK